MGRSRAKKPTRNQKAQISAIGLIPRNWLVLSEEDKSMVKGILELNDNGNISEKVIDECDVAIVFGINPADEGTELQGMLLGGGGCKKSLIINALADGVLSVVAEMGGEIRQRKCSELQNLLHSWKRALSIQFRS